MHETKEESDEEEGQRYVHFLTLLHVRFKTTLDIQLGSTVKSFQLTVLHHVVFVSAGLYEQICISCCDS